MEINQKYISVILKEAKLSDRKEFIKEAAIAYGTEQARLVHNEILKETGESFGSKFQIPVSLAARVSGFNITWIRRNLPIIKAEGQDDSIKFGALVDAVNEREAK